AGGGVRSGMDFGWGLVAEIGGETVAQAIQLGIEYDPDPPFDSGHPDRASDAVKATVFPRYEKAECLFAKLSTARRRPKLNNFGACPLLALSGHSICRI